jgi:hypothetical protein
MKKVSLLCILFLGGALIAQAGPADPVDHSTFQKFDNAASAVKAEAKAGLTGFVGFGAREVVPNTSRQGGETCDTAVPIAAVPTSVTGTTTGYVDDYDEVCPYAGSTSPDVVYSFTPADDVTLSLTTVNAGTDYDTKLYIYDSCPVTPGSPVACNDDTSSSVYQSTIAAVQLTGGTTYYIVVDGWNGEFGDYQLDIAAVDPEICPDGSQYAARPFTPSESWGFNGSDIEFPQLIADNFAGLITPVNSVTWWGVEWDGAINCEIPSLQFDITFYDDAASAPGTQIATETVTPLREPTGIIYDNGSVQIELIRYSSAITPVDVPGGLGWITIQCTAPTGRSCVWLWSNSPVGVDALHCEGDDFATLLCDQDNDMAYCLGGNEAFGACCDDFTGTCEDGISNLECDGRFVPDTACADIAPACGQAEGACCLFDGGCQILTAADCLGFGAQFCLGDMNCDGVISPADIDPFVIALTQGEAGYLAQFPNCFYALADCNQDTVVSSADIDAFVQILTSGDCILPSANRADPIGVWLGVDSTCDMCPCVLDCTGTDEGEVCGEDTNGGCNNDPGFEEFTVLTPGVTYCGNYWAADGTRDTDWYEITIGTPAILNIEFNSVRPAAAVMPSQISPGTAGCDNLGSNVLALVEAGGCTMANGATDCLDAGTYYLVVRPDEFDNIPCGGYNEYSLLVTATTCTVCDVNCTGTPEGETECFTGYVDQYNAGCNTDPNVFSSLSCGQTICGTSGTFVGDGGGATRDTDWYEITTTADFEFTLTLEAEFTATMFLIAIPGGNCDNLVIIDELVEQPACTPGSIISPCAPAGTYYVFVSTSTFEGVQCGKEYSLTLDCTSCVVPCNIPCPDGSLVEEEPCGADLNGGCNNDDVPTFSPLACDDVICGTSWADGGTRDTDWYEFTITEDTLVDFDVFAEFPVTVIIITNTVNGAAECDDLLIYDENAVGTDVPCSPGGAGVFDCLPPGTYWFFVGVNGFEGYPCDGINNDYYLVMNCSPCNYQGQCQQVGCPAGSNAEEGELPCTDPSYVDINPGCDGNGTVQHFPPDQPLGTPLDCDFTEFVCGTFGIDDGGDPDTDWYEIVLDSPTTVTLDYECSVDIRLELYGPNPTCPVGPEDLIASLYGPPCQPQSDPVGTPPDCLDGTYWLRVFPGALDSVDCPTEYWIWISLCESCEASCVTCTNNENEPCGDSTNDGCFVSPNAFLPVQFGQEICGTIWNTASPQARDSDWFQFTVTQPGQVTMTVESDVPNLRPWLQDPDDANQGCSGTNGYWILTTPVAACTVVTLSPSDTWLPGTYIAMLRPEGTDPNSFPPTASPCDPELSDYTVTFNFTPTAAKSETQKGEMTTLPSAPVQKATPQP